MTGRRRAVPNAGCFEAARSANIPHTTDAIIAPAMTPPVLYLWIRPELEASVARIARSRGWSHSATVWRALHAAIGKAVVIDNERHESRGSGEDATYYRLFVTNPCIAEIVGQSERIGVSKEEVAEAMIRAGLLILDIEDFPDRFGPSC